MNQKFQGNMQKYLVDGYDFLNYSFLGLKITLVILCQTWSWYDGVSNTAHSITALALQSPSYVYTKCGVIILPYKITLCPAAGWYQCQTGKKNSIHMVFIRKKNNSLVQMILMKKCKIVYHFVYEKIVV